MNLAISKDDREFLLDLLRKADIQAWVDLEESRTHWEEEYYNDVIETCERIEKELMKK